MTRRPVVWPVMFLMGLVLCFVAASCGTIGGLDDFREVDCIGTDCADGGLGAQVGRDGEALPPATVGGTVSGLLGTGLVLQNAGVGDLTVEADGAFTFPALIESGAAYEVTVSAQPSSPSQGCTVQRGSGTMKGVNITDVLVTCSTAARSIGGSVVGLDGSGTGPVLTNNGGDDLPIPANGGAFKFPTMVASGSPFAVEIKAQPTSSAPCTVSGGTGVVGVGDVTGVLVNCTPNMFTVGGTITGLVGTAVLAYNGANDLTVTASGSFAFPQTHAPGSDYAVTVLTQPSYPPRSQTCTIANGTGKVETANVTNIAITCATNSFQVGGSVTGLTGTVILQKNGADPVTVTADGPFNFTTTAQSGGTYNVTVRTQPAGQTCTVTAGSGTAKNGNVTNVAVACKCTSAPGPCSSDATCCGMKCNEQRSCVASCGAAGASCFPGISPCCLGSTCELIGIGYKCQACVGSGQACRDDQECCSGTCTGQKCQP